MANSNIDGEDRRELYEAYIKLREGLETVRMIVKRTNEWPAAKAYWFGSISVGISDEEYVTRDTTLRSFLVNQGIIDDCDEFIE